MSAINLSYYDLTSIQWLSDLTDDGSVPQSGTWFNIGAGFKSLTIKKMESRLKLYAKSQTRQFDKSVKNWAELEYEFSPWKFDAGSPNYGWWDIISQAFYGGATGSPVLRPGRIYFSAAYNRATIEYWLLSGAMISEVAISGDFTKDELSVNLKGMGRGFQFNTTNPMQGSTTLRTNTLNPIVPSNDCTLKINNIDVSKIVQNFVLTLTRKYESRGRSNTVAATSSQIAMSGANWREFTPNTFDGKLTVKLDPYGTNTQQVIDYINDTALAVCELQAENVTNGKQIQFTASKTQKADQQHKTEKTPSEIDLDIEGSTFNVNTL
jgi:hypothetical protein